MMLKKYFSYIFFFTSCFYLNAAHSNTTNPLRGSAQQGMTELQYDQTPEEKRLKEQQTEGRELTSTDKKILCGIFTAQLCCYCCLCCNCDAASQLSQNCAHCLYSTHCCCCYVSESERAGKNIPVVSKMGETNNITSV